MTRTDRHTTSHDERIIALLSAEWRDYHEGYDEDDGILTDDRLADLLDTYRRLVADGYDEQTAIDEAIAIVAGAQ